MPRARGERSKPGRLVVGGFVATVEERYREGSGYSLWVDGQLTYVSEVHVQALPRVGSADAEYGPFAFRVRTVTGSLLSLADEVEFLLDRDGVEELLIALKHPETWEESE